jgi:hypothetical protein
LEGYLETVVGLIPVRRGGGNFTDLALKHRIAGEIRAIDDAPIGKKLLLQISVRYDQMVIFLSDVGCLEGGRLPELVLDRKIPLIRNRGTNVWIPKA